MAVTERQRRHLHEQAEAAMDNDAADTLMEYLPPVGWQDVATKQDLRASEERLIGVLHHELRKQTIHFLYGLLGTVASVTTLPIVLERVL